MVVSRKTMAILTVIMMIACTVPFADDPIETDAAGDGNGILLYQVNSFGKDEGFTLRNYSTDSVDLRGYTVTDGEGSIFFGESLRLGPSHTVTVVMKKTDGPFSGQPNTLAPGESGVEKQKNFALNDNGDDVVLTDASGRLLDSFYYGSFDGERTGWTGENFQPKKGMYAQRSGDHDSDSADDWFNIAPGHTNLPLEIGKFTGDVTPFLFPESGGIPVYQALERAEKSVCIQIYEIRSPNVWALLVELEKRNVEVTVLHEGSPVGNTVPKYIAPYMHYFIENGGEVRLIGGTNADRYDNMHAKYAVIDGETVIVTSENWSTTNMNGRIDDNPYSGQDGNRGWGAIVESPGYARYMTDIFENDWSKQYGDTRDFMDVHGESKTTEVTYRAPQSAEFRTYDNVKITPVMSDDNSYEAIGYFIDGAQERVYSQQQSLSSYYADPTDESSPVYMMGQKAAAGVDARFILGGGFNKDDSAKAENTVININTSTQVSAAVMNDPYVHNKGLICDDAVWVSSINWTPTSVEKNRECCVVLHSGEIADFFAESFLEDFNRNYTYDGFSVDTSKLQSSYPSGQETVFEVFVNPEGDYTYHWDFGDGGERDTTVPKVAYTPADGAHVLKVTVTSSDGVSTTVEKSYYVGSDPADPDGSGESVIPGVSDEELASFMPYLVPILAVLIALCIAVSKITGRKKSKGKKRD